MKRILLLGLMAAGLTACQEPGSTIQFDTSTKDISFPNDLWFLGSDDGTLNIDIDEETNALGYIASLNATDGWSTHMPFEIGIDFLDGAELDSTSITAEAVKLYQVVTGEDCMKPVKDYQVCTAESALIYGSDFTAEATSSGLKIVPLAPLEAKTTYLLVLTDSLMDSTGRSVMASAQYHDFQMGFATPETREAQRIIQSYEKVAMAQGVDRSHIIYSMAMTTQSTQDVLLAVKQQVVENGPTDLHVADSGLDLATLLNASGYELSATQQALFSTGQYYGGSLSLPYYLGISTADDPYAPLYQHWNATEQVGSDFHLTQYNSLPAENTVCEESCISNPGDITVQMTVPNISDAANAVRTAYGLSSLSEPVDGWPVIILQHGITSQKSDFLAVTGILSLYGFATVAIDFPLHGDRGFDLDSDGTDDINASTNSYSDYISLSYMLTTRDNTRQGIADLLGLRFALQNVTGANLNATDVQFVGHSLGAITGLSFSALANESTGDAATDEQFRIDSLSLEAPGVGVPSFLIESYFFGDAIESGLAYLYSEAFQVYVSENGYGIDELSDAYSAFYAALDEESQLEIDSLLDVVILSSQTATDSGDPVNYTAALAESGASVHVMEVVGNGTDNLWDLVIPNTVTTNPNAGTEPVISQLGMTSVDSSGYGTSQAVRFAYGYHSSILSTARCVEVTFSDDAFDKCEAATAEMQSQMASFMYSRGQYLTITDSGLIQEVTE